jgi:hypothetical protein
VLALADMTWDSGQRGVAQQLYHRLCAARPDVLAPDEKERALERAGLVKPRPVVAPAEKKREWLFHGADAHGVPADWSRLSPVAPDRRVFVRRFERFQAEQGDEGLELSGVGRLLAGASWTAHELQVDLEATLAGGAGVGITLGDYAEGDENVFLVAGYGLRFTPRDKGAAFAPRSLFARHDGLWVTTTGFPDLAALDGAPEDREVDGARDGKVALRLTAKRDAGRLRVQLARLVDGKPRPILEGTLSKHLPGGKTALRAGVVVTNFSDDESVTLERFSVTPR